ncbi:hypothetical protein THRCLA_02088 [Thraustotheca clavata]|uniref:GH18 domain-containing protein n=1 Tax=Thraustotheca clavata TaxID=74557 RepID=A0A1W0A6K5_9STRA|nr:hypothetical protein THRCLA_02088 [Thraustotheca clavata]
MPNQLSTPTGEFEQVASPQYNGSNSTYSIDQIYKPQETRQNTITTSCLCRSILPVIFMICIVIGILGAIGTFSSQGKVLRTLNNPLSLNAETLPPNAPNVSCASRGTFLSNASCKVCPKRSKVFAVYWETPIDCLDFTKSSAATYVTHIYWSFAWMETNGSVSNILAGKLAMIKTCIAQARSQCIKSYISIGGVNMRWAFLSLTSSSKIADFASSAAQIVVGYGFDGIAINDVSGNLHSQGNWKKYAGPNVLAYLTSLKVELNQLPRSNDEPVYELTWDEFPTSLNDNCDTTFGDYQRCFDVRVASIVDRINLLMYNAPSSVDYDNYLDVILPTQWAKVVNVNKIVLGGCIGPVGSPGGCAYGAVPTSTQLLSYATQGAKNYGGVIIWTGSRDFIVNQGAVTIAMGSTGGYLN